MNTKVSVSDIIVLHYVNSSILSVRVCAHRWLSVHMWDMYCTSKHQDITVKHHCPSLCQFFHLCHSLHSLHLLSSISHAPVFLNLFNPIPPLPHIPLSFPHPSPSRRGLATGWLADMCSSAQYREVGTTTLSVTRDSTHFRMLVPPAIALVQQF